MHFTVLVIIPDKDKQITTGEQIYRAVEEMLAPYSEHLEIKKDRDSEYMYNPDGRWDWWLIGGRWTGFFETVPGAGFIGEPGVMTHENSDPYLADAVRNIDITGGTLNVHTVLDKEGWQEISCFNLETHASYYRDDILFDAIVSAHPNDWFVCVDCHA